MSTSRSSVPSRLHLLLNKPAQLCYEVEYKIPEHGPRGHRSYRMIILGLTHLRDSAMVNNMQLLVLALSYAFVLVFN